MTCFWYFCECPHWVELQREPFGVHTCCSSRSLSCRRTIYVAFRFWVNPQFMVSLCFLVHDADFYWTYTRGWDSWAMSSAAVLIGGTLLLPAALVLTRVQGPRPQSTVLPGSCWGSDQTWLYWPEELTQPHETFKCQYNQWLLCFWPAKSCAWSLFLFDRWLTDSGEFLVFTSWSRY